MLKRKKRKEEEENKKLLELSKKLADPKEDLVESFIDNEEYRRAGFRSLSHFPVHLISGFISLLDKCIDETWKRSEPRGAFDAYNQNLAIILDILTLFDVGKIPPALFQTAAYGLERVGYYIGTMAGQSWSAANTWERRKGELSKEMIRELKDIAEQHSYFQVKRLLGQL